MATIKETINDVYPVTQWTRNTIADGNALNKKTIKPLIERDNYIADQIDGFQAQIDAEAEARQDADTILSNDLATERAERIEQYTGFEKLVSDEAAARAAADEEIVDSMSDHINKMANDSTIEGGGHITHDEYNIFNGVYTTVNTHSGNWDNISAINAGTTKITASDVYFTGENHIAIEADATTNTITVKTDGSVGDVSTPIYIDSNGNFQPCSLAGNSENKFGNAIISLNKNKAMATCYVNGNGERAGTKVTYTSKESTPLYKYKNVQLFTPFEYGSSDILNKCLEFGVNNFNIRFDAYSGFQTYNDIPDVGVASNNIFDLAVDVDKLEKYKLYNLNMVPLYLANDLIPSYKTMNMQYSITFSSANTPINFSDGGYKCDTYGYFYNVPAFLENKRDFWEINYTSYDAEGKPTEATAYTSFDICENEEIKRERWQVALNDTGVIDIDDASVSKYVAMQTLMPHSALEIYTPNAITVKAGNDTSDIESGGKVKLGSNKISAIYMDACTFESVTNEYDETWYKPVLARRQISFMRGDDITSRPASDNITLIKSSNALSVTKFNVAYNRAAFMLDDDLCCKNITDAGYFTPGKPLQTAECKFNHKLLTYINNKIHNKKYNNTSHLRDTITKIILTYLNDKGLELDSDVYANTTAFKNAYFSPIYKEPDSSIKVYVEEKPSETSVASGMMLNTSISVRNKKNNSKSTLNNITTMVKTRATDGMSYYVTIKNAENNGVWRPVFIRKLPNNTIEEYTIASDCSVTISDTKYMLLSSASSLYLTENGFIRNIITKLLKTTYNVSTYSTLQSLIDKLAMEYVSNDISSQESFYELTTHTASCDSSTQQCNLDYIYKRKEQTGVKAYTIYFFSNASY